VAPLNVAVMSSPRQPSYLDQTLRSLFASDGAAELQVRVVVDGADPVYTGDWKNHASVDVEVLSVELNQELQKLSVDRRISETCFRCLRAAPPGDLLLCQDDVEFAPHWLQATRDSSKEAAARLEGRFFDGAPLAGRYVLALYTTKALRSTDRPLALYKPAEFYGNQALFIPATIMAELTPYFEQSRHTGLMDDMIVKQFLVQRSVVLHAVNPNVVQHIGTHCTHQGSFHQSPSYGKW